MSNQNSTTLHAENTLRAWLAAPLAISIATVVGWLIFHGLRWPDQGRAPRVADTTVLMLYLLAVMGVAVHFTRGAALLASLLSVAAFDFFFVKPYLTWSVLDERYWMTFAVMLVTGLTISTLTDRLRRQSAATARAWNAAEAEFLRNTLLSSVSHDLRTPISAITGAATVLQDNSDRLSSAQKTEMLETIASEADRMERLVNNLLDMTRLDSGKLVLKREWQHLQEIVGSALRHTKKRRAGRVVKTDFQHDLPLLFLDAVAIEQVVVNLIDNAVQHAPGDSPIEIRAFTSGDVVTLEVADRGPGLPRGADARIFEKFFRATAGSSGGGLGLGLAICRGLVTAHGGTIHAQNREGGGATFRIEFPQQTPPPPPDATL